MDSPGEPMPAVLRRLESELASVAGQLSNVELALVRLTGRPAAIDADLLADLQQLDHALQALMALKAFAGGLAILAGQGWLVDARKAAGHLKLSDVAARLGGGACGAAAPGEIELF